MKLYHIFVLVSVIGIVSLMGLSASARGVVAQNFVHEAMVAGKFEVESSRLALERSQNEDVRKVAQQMIDDHLVIGDRLRQILRSSSIRTDHTLDGKHQKLMGVLKTVPDQEFDAKYVEIQFDAHQEAVDLFNDYIENGKNSSLRDFAQDTLPTLQDHLVHIEDLTDTTQSVSE